MNNLECNSISELVKEICTDISEIEVKTFVDALNKYGIKESDKEQILTLIVYLLNPKSFTPPPQILPASFDYIDEEIKGIRSKPKNFIDPLNNLVNTEIGFHRLFLDNDTVVSTLQTDIHEVTKQDLISLVLKHARYFLNSDRILSFRATRKE